MNHVLLDLAGHVAAITLNRPKAANAIDLALARELQSTVQDVVSRDEVRAIVLLGHGPHFCAGGDVQAMLEEPASWAEEVAAGVHEAILALHQSDKVIIAGARGAVAGAGLSLALVSDLVVASASTRFLSAWGAIGLTPDGGATWLLPRVIGSRRAASMMLDGGEVLGPVALDWGLVTELVADAAIEDRARALATHVLSSETTAPGTTARMLRSNWDVDLATRLDQEREAVSAARHESQAALTAFHSRRAGRMRGIDSGP